MIRIMLVVALSLPALASAQFGSAREGSGFFGRRASGEQTAPASSPALAPETRQLAQQPNVQFPQQQQRQQFQQQPPAPYNMQGPPPGQAPAEPAEPAATPRSRRSSATPTPAPSRKTPRAAEKPPAKKTDTAASSSDEGLENMVDKLDEGGKKATADEAAFAKAADDATTAVADFLRSANNGVYSKAASYLTPEVQKYFESELSAVNGPLKTVLDQVTRNGDIRSVTYSNIMVRGEGAVVDAELTFGTGPLERRPFDLLKTKSGWKIVLPINGQSVPVPDVPPADNNAVPAPTPLPMPSAADEPTTGAAAVATPAAAGVAAATTPPNGPAKPSALADAPWR